MLRILYRADGGHPVGTGHIQRMLRVIARLTGTQVVLVTRDTAFTRQAVFGAGMPGLRVEYLPPAPLEVIPTLVASEFEHIVRQVAPDVIVVDMLDTPGDEMARLRPLARTLVTLDDRGPGRLFADLICNFLVRDPDPSALSDGTWLREGPEYAPLAPEFVGVTRDREEPERVRRIMVTMGGADAVGLAVKVAQDLLRVEGLEAVDFNVGPAFQKRAELESVVSKARWKAHLHMAVPSLLPFYKTADLAIVAGGITMHEAACCGVPSIAVCQPIDHQVLVASALEEAGCMVNLGYGESLMPGAIAAEVAALSCDRPRRQSMSAAGPRVCDGFGAARVADLVFSRTRNSPDTPGVRAVG
jgi:spore coat polysaccharide biosynthesis predicted glycosyltransferase SpsG